MMAKAMVVCMCLLQEWLSFCPPPNYDKRIWLSCIHVRREGGHVFLLDSYFLSLGVVILRKILANLVVKYTLISISYSFTINDHSGLEGATTIFW